MVIHINYLKGRLCSLIHFGFSYIGLIYLLMLFIPNGIWAKNQPKDYDKYVKNENRILLFLERLGEGLTSCCALIFSDLNIRAFTLWSFWLLLSFVFMLLYEGYWIRYFRSKKTMQDMYAGFAGFPVAGASLPCLAFLCLGLYGSNIFLIVSALILSVGHIGIHLNHRKAVAPQVKKKLSVRIIKGILLFIPAELVITAIIAIAGRNINWFKNYIDTEKGVNASEYLEIGGQEQYFLMRGRDVSNPVILYLHGGPGSPDACVSNLFSDYLIDDYTVVCWEQRGCGRTYFRNKAQDPDNATVSFEQALSDTDEIVDMLRERFHAEQIMIMGHSYGSLLACRYIQAHPEKISRFVGIGQFVDLMESDRLAYQDALNIAAERGEDTSSLESVYEAYSKVCEEALSIVHENGDDITEYAKFLAEPGKMDDFLKLRSVTAPYHPASISANTILAAVFSPYTGVDDLRWLMKQMTDRASYLNINIRLMQLVYTHDLRDDSKAYDIPMDFISGDRDFICNYKLSEEYCNEITAPEKRFAVIKGCGHNPQFAEPERFSDTFKEMLAG